MFMYQSPAGHTHYPPEEVSYLLTCQYPLKHFMKLEFCCKENVGLSEVV